MMSPVVPACITSIFHRAVGTKCQPVIQFYCALLRPLCPHLPRRTREGILAKCHLNFISLYYFLKNKLDSMFTPSKETNLRRYKTECKRPKANKWEKVFWGIFERPFLLYLVLSHIYLLTLTVCPGHCSMGSSRQKRSLVCSLEEAEK